MLHIVRPVRIVAPTLGVAVAALALAACTTSGSGSGGSGSGSGDTSSGSTPPPVTTSSSVPPSTTTVTKSATVSPSSDEGGTSSSGGGSTSLSICAESQLRASLDPRPVSGSSTHGDYARIVDFVNTSTRACLIRGYPGAALTDTDGKQVKQATRTIRGSLLGLPTSQTTLPTVTLQPGATASAGIEGVNQQEVGAAQAGCDESYPGILVTPPNTSTPVPFDLRWPKCYSFTVHPTNIEKNPPS